MKLLQESRKEGYVRIIIGKVSYGEKNIQNPVKTISIVDSDVQEVYEKILKIIEKEK